VPVTVALEPAGTAPMLTVGPLVGPPEESPASPALNSTGLVPNHASTPLTRVHHSYKPEDGIQTLASPESWSQPERSPHRLPQPNPRRCRPLHSLARSGFSQNSSRPSGLQARTLAHSDDDRKMPHARADSMRKKARWQQVATGSSVNWRCYRRRRRSERTPSAPNSLVTPGSGTPFTLMSFSCSTVSASSKIATSSMSPTVCRGT